MPKLTPSQAGFVNSTATFPAFVGGFGSGKTAAGVVRMMRLKRYCPDSAVGYYLPTFPLIEDIVFERLPALLERNGIDHELNKSTATIRLSRGRIVARSMERPERIVGYEVGHSIVDELDTLKADKARAVWNKIIARNRQKCFTLSGRPVKNTVGVVTTPEGFRFVYERWAKNPSERYELHRGNTYENRENLPEGYIENLEESYPEALLAAYLSGQFVNLTHGRVYSEFDRHTHATFETIRAGEHLHIGMDFNVGKMSAPIAVIRGNKPLVLEEAFGLLDTPAMIAHLKARFIGHPVTVYPDASGNNRKSQNASESDIALLRQAGFTVLANPSNPAVRDRVLSVNAVLKKGELLVNPDACPNLVEMLEQQAYNQAGEPDKTSDLDHLPDALGYFIAYKFGLKRSTVTLHRLSGI